MKSIQYIKFLVIAFVIIIASQSIHAQSRYFDERYLYTQAHLSPQLINPGAYGSTPQQQILVNYRNKWAGIDGAPSTLTLSYNGPVGNGIGIGVNVLSDRFGSLETTKGAFGVSYSIKSPTIQIGFGISAEYIKHGLSGFGNADPLDPLIGLGLAGAEYFDATLGVYGTYMDRLTYGLSLPSVISSRITEIVTDTLDREIGIILQAGYKVDVQDDITMTPSIILKKLANVPTHLDLNLVFGFLDDKLIGVPGGVIETGPFRVTPFELLHPQGCIGYHVEADGCRFAYCTDVEMTERLRTDVGDMLAGVDALVLDAQYTRDEYEGRVGPSKLGWGHSTNVDAARIAQAVGARRLFLFHHDPAHVDAQVEHMAEEARRYFVSSEPARENKRITLG